MSEVRGRVRKASSQTLLTPLTLALTLPNPSLPNPRFIPRSPVHHGVLEVALQRAASTLHHDDVVTIFSCGSMLTFVP